MTDLPPPLVSLRQHPLRWGRNKLILTADAVVLAHVGVLIFAAIYYLATQTNPSVKHWWDTTVTPASLRHDIRDVGEGVLASCLAQAVVWNSFTRSHRRAGARLRLVRDRYHVPVVVGAIVSATVIGAVAFAIGEVILHVFSVHARTRAVHGSLWSRTSTLWTSGWDKKALGFVAALVARRPLHVLFDNVQHYFARRRAASGSALRWYHPPVFRGRVNHVMATTTEPRHYWRIVDYVVSVLVAVMVGLAGLGFYVLTYKP